MCRGMPGEFGVRWRDADHGVEPFSQWSPAGRIRPGDHSRMGQPWIRRLRRYSAGSLAAESLPWQPAFGPGGRDADVAGMTGDRAARLKGRSDVLPKSAVPAL